MLKDWRATYHGPALNVVDHPPLAVLWVRAEIELTARRLSRDVFEQVYGEAPESLGFVLVSCLPVSFG